MRVFARKARDILEWLHVNVEGDLEWPLHRQDDEYNELWISEVFLRLEEAFYPFFLRPVRRRAAETPWACQDRRDAVRMERQRRMAAAIWSECGPETARRYARILRAVPKPPRLPDVEARVAVLPEMERLDPAPRPMQMDGAQEIAKAVADRVAEQLSKRRSKKQRAAAKKGGGRTTVLTGEEMERVRKEAQRIRKTRPFGDSSLARMIRAAMSRDETAKWSAIPSEKTIYNIITGRTGAARRAEDRKSARNR